MSPSTLEPIQVIGTGLDPARLPLEADRIVTRAEVLVGGDRLLRSMPDHPAHKVSIRSPVQEAVDAADREQRAGKRVVVLADGDPGLFGIGRRFVDALGAERVRIHPNVSVLQAAAARLRTPWDDIRPVSLHGRTDLWPLRRGLSRGLRLGVYTDPAFDPSRIARELLRWGVETHRMHVLEELGRPGERIRTFDDPAVAAEAAFAGLTFVLLEPVRAPEVPLSSGLDESRLAHRNGLFTKREVRGVGLSLLGVERGHTVWDLGAGSGAVALEASALAVEGRVFAVERNPERWEDIRTNIRRTGAFAVEPVLGEMPACLEGLPDPDRAFLGGGVQQAGVLEAVTRRLRPGGRLVAHVVLLGSLRVVLDRLERAGWSPCVTLVQIGRSRPLSGDLRFEALNPVFVVSADRPG